MDLIIIPGASRCGTTSLYYFFESNQLNVSTEKQINFFIDPKFKWDGTDFKKHFRKPDSKIFIDVSPDYLYSPLFYENILEVIKIKEINVKLIVLLRNPVDRIYSWYKHGQQILEIPKNETFEEYLIKNSPHHKLESYRAVHESNYSFYLNKLYKLIDKKDILVIYTESLKSKELVNIIFEFLGLNYIENYSPMNYSNQSGQIKWSIIWKGYKIFRIFIIKSLKFVGLFSITKPIRRYLGNKIRYSLINKSNYNDIPTDNQRDKLLDDWRKTNSKYFMDQNLVIPEEW